MACGEGVSLFPPGEKFRDWAHVCLLPGILKKVFVFEMAEFGET